MYWNTQEPSKEDFPILANTGEIFENLEDLQDVCDLPGNNCAACRYGNEKEEHAECLACNWLGANQHYKAIGWVRVSSLIKLVSFKEN
jgi:hypothetical protein